MRCGEAGVWSLRERIGKGDGVERREILFGGGGDGDRV